MCCHNLGRLGSSRTNPIFDGAALYCFGEKKKRKEKRQILAKIVFVTQESSWSMSCVFALGSFWAFHFEKCSLCIRNGSNGINWQHEKTYSKLGSWLLNLQLWQRALSGEYGQDQLFLSCCLPLTVLWDSSFLV